ncbi:MAG: FAD-binding oxidoreductase [Candidatus Heimdallarchaeaceae archaeon]
MTTSKIIAESIPLAPFEEIRSVKGEDNISEHFPNYLVDESKISGGRAEWLFFPKSEEEIASILVRMQKEKIPITISAARTGIVGSAVPYGGAILSLERLDEMIGIGFDEKEKRWFVRVQPNLTLNQINDIIKGKKFKKEQSIPIEKNWVEKFEEEETHYYPVDPTEMTASIGGTIGTNASGARTFKYGATREWVRRIRLILGTGDVLDIPRGKYRAENGKFVIVTKGKEIAIKIPTYKMPEAKNAAGLYAKPDMDLIDLFIGSEGVFGVISEADIWIKKYTPQVSCIAFFQQEDDALAFVDLLRANKTVDPEFIEFFDDKALALLKDTQKEDPKFVDMPDISEEDNTAISFDLHYSEESLKEKFEEVGLLLEQANSSLEKTWCAYEEREIARFKHFRHAVPEIVNNTIAERKKQYPRIHKLGTDMSVEDRFLKEMMHFYHKTLEESKLEYVIWGHIGNNHVHVNILPRNMEELEQGQQLYKKFAKKAVEFGGSVSAEHGIGKIKHEYLKIMFGEEAINQMREVKCKLDPYNLINPGNIFPVKECEVEE